MKIMIIARDFAPDVGGVQNLLARLSETLKPGDLTVLTRQIKGWQSHDQAVPYRVVRIPSFASLPSALSAIARGIFLLFYSLFLAWQVKPELTIAAYTKGDAPFGWILKTFFSIPYVVFAYGMEVVRYKGQNATLIKKWLKEAKVVAAISEPVKNFVDAFTEGKANTIIVPLGCGVSGQAPYPPLAGWKEIDFAGKQLALTVCRLTPRKGVDKTIEAIALLKDKHPDLIYTIVGDGDDRKRLQKLVKENKLENRVIFAGRVSDEDLLRFYARCDLLVLASREEGSDIEGFGLVFVEAGAFSKPVIGGDSGGIRQAVAHEENGLLVDPKSPNAIAKAIARVLGDQTLAAQLGKEGKRRATEVFTWDNCKDTLIEALTGQD